MMQGAGSQGTEHESAWSQNALVSPFAHRLLLAADGARGLERELYDDRLAVG